ncbi:ACT domain-containing protein DS12, chloroplastic-like isoform X2 [Zingiber officinale]|nr:ACT domain-containing protein DS12, chloroplastic-like isoform X2 [Zingiber officinale]
MAKRVDKQVNLFYCAECEELARKVADHSDAIQLRTISWRCPSQHTPRATYPTVVEDDSSKETDRIPTPKVIIDQDSNPDATIVEVAFGDRLGALLDTVFDPVPWIVPHIL